MSSTHEIDANDWLLQSGVRSAKFENIGDSVVGHILRPPEVQHQRDITTNEPRYWPDGKARLQLKVILMTEEQDPEDADDSGERSVYIKGQMQQAVSQAVRKAGASGLQVGGKLLVRYVGDGKVSQRGFNPPKLYEARYRAPEPASTAVDSFDDPTAVSAPTPSTNRAKTQAKPIDLDSVPF